MEMDNNLDEPHEVTENHRGDFTLRFVIGHARFRVLMGKLVDVRAEKHLQFRKGSRLSQPRSGPRLSS